MQVAAASLGEQARTWPPGLCCPEDNVPSAVHTTLCTCARLLSYHVHGACLVAQRQPLAPHSLGAPQARCLGWPQDG